MLGQLILKAKRKLVHVRQDEVRIHDRQTLSDIRERAGGGTWRKQEARWERIVDQVGNRRTSSVERTHQRRGRAEAGALNVAVARIQVIPAPAAAHHQLL